MQIKRQFYEFLARGGRDGALQGYHVICADVLCDDKGNPIKNENGENKMETFTPPLSLQNAGTDLPGILNEVLGAALKKIDELQKQINELGGPQAPITKPTFMDKIKGVFKWP